jgi:hypothetical protein
MAPPTQPVWALNETAKGAITISRGLLQAATCDNVSPLALMACESFGSLLPACPETRLRIEQLARRNHTSQVLKFISAQIGYMKGDSVEVLSESDGGIRFLCLAATFCTLDRYEAALRIDSLLEATRARNELRPTLSQLQSMMTILESKLIFSEFTTSVAGWVIWFEGQLLRPGDDLFRAQARIVPPKKSLQEMILLMSETHRLGEEQSVLIRSTSSYVPWLIAFIKWLLGEPPFVQLATGRVLNDQKNPQILLIVLTNGMPEPPPAEGTVVADLQVSASYCNKSLKSLVMEGEQSERSIRWQGLMTASDWVSYKLRCIFYLFPEGKQNQELLEIVAQVIYFIVGVVPDRSNFGWREEKVSHEGRRPAPTPSFSSLLGCSPFPDAQERIALARELLGAQLPPFSPCYFPYQKLQLKVLIEKMEEDLFHDVVTLGTDLMILSLFGNNPRIMPMITPYRM